VLADRLKRLLAASLITKAEDPTHRQKGIYSLTEPAIQLVPLLAQLGAWGRRHAPVSEGHCHVKRAPAEQRPG
jgi:DNA-binding HxlR family transcriptional regulator